MKYLVIALLGLIGTMSAIKAETIQNKQQIAEKAYIYGFPLVLMDITKDVMTATQKVTATRAPLNQFVNKRTFPDASFTDVVSPNADTLYSSAWLDLSQEPIILSVPDMGDRYYLFPMLDEWTNVFFSPGTRTTGNRKQEFVIIGPNWKGYIPKEMQSIKAPTNIVWIIGRIQTNGKSDYAAVNKLQDQFKLTPLSAWGKADSPKINYPLSSNVNLTTPPSEQVLSLNGVAFFTKLAELLKTTVIPSQDADYVKKFSEIGLIPGKDFDASQLSSEDINALNQAVKAAQARIQKEWNLHSFAVNENGWGVISKGIGTYGTNYGLRAVVAYGGLGANLPQDAIYPTTQVDDTGQRLNGKFQYVIHFDKGQLPPVNGFWSITMYNEKQFFVANALNRYAIGNRNPLKFNEDGSLDIYIQHTSPGSEKESNWLPAPEGDFNLILRLYAPKEAILNGSWQPPKVQKINGF